MKRSKLVFIIVLLLSGCALEARYNPPAPPASPTITSPTLYAPPSPTLELVPAMEYVVITPLEKRTCPSVSCANVGYYQEGDIVIVNSWFSDANLPECQSWAHIANQDHWVCANFIVINTYLPGDVYVLPEYDANDYEVCVESAPVYGRPAGITVYYYLEAGTIVHIREMSKGVLGWAMIEDSRWILLEYLCIVK